MSDRHPACYTVLDRPEVLSVLFHPRRQHPWVETTPGCQEVLIPVEDGIKIGGRFYLINHGVATILFFHGNGEIAADYDELGPLYNQMGINFLVVDYRGYGCSDGTPTVTTMLNDCHKILDYVTQFLSRNKVTSPLVIMGRSLGSASALELAYKHSSTIAGLIIESGFAYAGPLLQLLGISPENIGFKEDQGFGNLDKIKMFTNPTLIIHAEFDHIIPFSDGEKLFETSPAAQKTLLKIPHANHNDIFAQGLKQYMSAIKDLMLHI
ncbi:MAG: alpha/beta fold hydrolase [Desulfobacteraceae bacterium]|jgi:alpha-beta hydrolase superfamily lysophospholipase